MTDTRVQTLADKQRADLVCYHRNNSSSAQLKANEQATLARMSLDLTDAGADECWHSVFRR